MTIPLRLRARPQEPGHGALLRLSIRNGRHVVTSFATSLGVHLRDALAGRDAARIAELSGLSPTAVAWWSPAVSAPDRLVTIAGEELSLGDWSIARRRHCPECLRADVAEARRLGLPGDWLASHRSVWDIRSVAACPEHGVALVDACHACAAPLGWRDPRRLACPACRADLTAPSEPLDDPLGLYVAARIGIGRSERPAVLEELPLRHAVRLCGKLGRAGLDAAPENNTAGVPALEFAVEGFRRAVAGPAGLDDVFDRLLARRATDAPDGLGGAYGWLHDEWLGTDDPTAAAYRDVLRDHAVANGVIAPDEERLGASPPPTINLTQAAAVAGVAIERMRRLLDGAGAIPPGSRRGVSFALDPGVVALAGRRKGAVRRAAREALGVGRSALVGLAEAGLVDLSDEDGFRASAERLMAAVGRQLCAGSPPDGTSPLPVATVAASVPMSRVVEVLLQGCIPSWRAGDGDCLAAIVVRAADLCPLRARPDGYTGVAAAQSLRLHPECVRALIRDGTLVRGDDGLIAAADLEAFRSTYVAGGELARIRGRSPARLVADLAEAASARRGLSPRTDRRSSGGRNCRAPVKRCIEHGCVGRHLDTVSQGRSGPEKGRASRRRDRDVRPRQVGARQRHAGRRTSPALHPAPAHQAGPEPRAQDRGRGPSERVRRLGHRGRDADADDRRPVVGGRLRLQPPRPAARSNLSRLRRERPGGLLVGARRSPGLRARLVAGAVDIDLPGARCRSRGGVRPMRSDPRRAASGRDMPLRWGEPSGDRGRLRRLPPRRLAPGSTGLRSADLASAARRNAA